MEDGWISVTERLPFEGVDVVVVAYDPMHPDMAPEIGISRLKNIADAHGKIIKTWCANLGIVGLPTVYYWQDIPSIHGLTFPLVDGGQMKVTVS